MTKISNLYGITNVLTADVVNNRIGIGIASPTEKFEIAGLNGNIRIYGRSGIGENQIASNVYYNGSIWTRDNTSYGASSIILDSTNGQLLFNTTSSTSGYPSERMRITSAGNVGIGTTSPNSYDPSGNNLVVYEAGNAGITIATGATNWGSIFFARATGTADAYRGYIEYGQSSDYMAFGTVSTERMRITSGGNVLIGSTTAVSSRMELRIGGNSIGSRISMGLNGTNYAALVLDSGGNPVWTNEYNDSGIRMYVINYNNGVYLTQSATSWTANSDERLKTDLLPIENAINKVDKLRAVTGRFKIDEETKRRSFLIAQDVLEVLPEAVSIDSKTGMLGVQYTEVIPLLVASIKELKAELDILKNK